MARNAILKCWCVYVMAGFLLVLSGCGREAWYELKQVDVFPSNSREEHAANTQGKKNFRIESDRELIAIVVPEWASGYSDAVFIAVLKDGTQYAQQMDVCFPRPKKYTPEAVHFLHDYEFETPEDIFECMIGKHVPPENASDQE